MHEFADAFGMYGLAGSLRIVHLAKFFPPERGGMETYVRDLALAQAGAGHEVIVLAHAGHTATGTEEPLRGVRVLRCKVWGSAGGYAPLAPLFPFVLHRVARTFRPHVLHVHCPNPAAVWCLLPGMLPSRTRFVAHWHSDVVFPPDKAPPRPLVALWRVLEKALLHRAARIFATSGPYMESSPFLRPWRDKCQVLPLTISPVSPYVPEGFRHPAVDFLRGPVGQTSLGILAVGRLAHYKGFDVLLRAVAQVPEARCCIVGTGEEEAPLRRLIAELRLEERVLLAGDVDEIALTASYRACGVFCLSSTMRTEAFGIVLLEALREGKWCIASDVPGSGMATVVRHGENGWLVSPGDVGALVKVLNIVHPGVPRGNRE